MRDIKIKVEFDIALTLVYDPMWFSEMEDVDCSKLSEYTDTGGYVQRDSKLYNLIHDEDNKRGIAQYIAERINDPEFNKYIDIRVVSIDDLTENELKEIYEN